MDNEKVDSQKTAIIVVDIQKDFCSPQGFGARTWGHDISHFDEIIDRIISFVGAAEGKGAEVVYTQLIYDPEKMPKSISKKLGPFTGTYMAPNTEGIEFYKINPPAEKVFVKSGFSAFSNEDLLSHMKDKGVEKVVIVGFNSNICVEATARHAVDLGFHTTIVKDLISTPTFWKSHEGQTLATFELLFGEVKTSEEVIKDFDGEVEE